MSDDKLDSLEDRIHEAQVKANPPPPPSADANRTVGMRAGSEFIAHVIAGGLMGWGLDSWLGTAPLALVGMILLGFGTGIYRASKVIST